jgi:DNA sulfur modification protein DndC
MKKWIDNRVSKNKQVVILLGTRKSESSVRAKAMERNKIGGHRFQRHPTMLNAFVFAPLAGWETEDVWKYLIQVPPPWGGTNDTLVDLYGKTHRIDEDYTGESGSPEWGDSRFGCWTCTLVDEDKALKGLIESGNEWMTPLLDFRNQLKETQDPRRKPEFRSHKHLDGRVYVKGKDGKLSYGPYRLSFCKTLLRKLLQAQETVRREGPDPDITLITEDELKEIRRIWKTERNDWQDSLPTIVKQVTGQDLGWFPDDTAKIDWVNESILDRVCERHSVPLELAKELIGVERRFWGMARRSSIFEEIDKIMKMDWRTEQQVMEELNGHGDSTE